MTDRFVVASGPASSEPIHEPQIKSRQRVRDLAEVYTHSREVNAMLDLVPSMFPSELEAGNTDRKFLEPACGSGNFLEAILVRKLKFVTARRYGRGATYEFRVVRSLASIYGIDVNSDNVEESKQRLRGVITSHLDNDLNTTTVSDAFHRSVDFVLERNIVRANALTDSDSIVFIDFAATRGCAFRREWSPFGRNSNEPTLIAGLVPRADEVPVHYLELADYPDPRITSPGPVVSRRVS